MYVIVFYCCVNIVTNPATSNNERFFSKGFCGSEIRGQLGRACPSGSRRRGLCFERAFNQRRVHIQGPAGCGQESSPCGCEIHGSLFPQKPARERMRSTHKGLTSYHLYPRLAIRRKPQGPPHWRTERGHQKAVWTPTERPLCLRGLWWGSHQLWCVK